MWGDIANWCWTGDNYWKEIGCGVSYIVKIEFLASPCPWSHKSKDSTIGTEHIIMVRGYQPLTVKASKTVFSNRIIFRIVEMLCAPPKCCPPPPAPSMSKEEIFSLLFEAKGEMKKKNHQELWGVCICFWGLGNLSLQREVCLDLPQTQGRERDRVHCFGDDLVRWMFVFSVPTLRELRRAQSRGKSNKVLQRRQKPLTASRGRTTTLSELQLEKLWETPAFEKIWTLKVCQT